MILIIVYVGAVAVLFLFVVMMLDVDFAELKEGFLRNLPFGVTVGGIVLIEPRLLRRRLAYRRQHARADGLRRRRKGITNTAALGRVIYTQYAYLFEASGLVLLTAMIGAIVLTLHHKQGVKRQNIAEQNARTAATAVELKKQPSSGGGFDDANCAWALSRRRCDPVHARRGRYHQSEKHHRHPDVGRVDPAGGHINLVAFSAFLGDLTGQVFALVRADGRRCGGRDRPCHSRYLLSYTRHDRGSKTST